ncbi:Uncharacterized protein BM_BM17544 [Brugia malayi]|uniref:Bm1184 n=1 Tax=Brugia malayi TaxID=6279 RepID=A0A4E9FGE8_BRUMA|nr:Uncharacterized protein BM_BM17544 [Brugia malayi]VIO94758.1 Uncharacterized protein BM_BM17544 [Brugia malayi]
MNQNITSLFVANEMNGRKYGTVENNTTINKNPRWNISFFTEYFDCECWQKVENNNFNFHKETS